MENLCPQCGAPIQAGATTCQYCGAAVPAAAPAQNQAANTQQPVIIVQSAPQPQPQPQPQPEPQIDPRQYWPIKSKVVAGILAILLGGIGVHKFYLGQTGKGVLYLLFCWTYIPSIISFIEGIIILCSNTENFELKYCVRAEK